ncbi:MAG: response regulator [Patescibacteria group bacterium]|jgi:CheY-like chemotaxis protein
MKNYTILVVEDERPLAEAIKAKLTKSGFEVVTARQVKQALNYLEDKMKISAIWLDHYLIGEENGLDFVAKIKNNEQWKKIPVFVVSNTASAEKVKSYLRLGVNKYYTKADFRLEDIISDIKEYLEHPKD